MKIITITGPTCSGKSTLEKELASRGYGKIISHTTREPRVGEVDGEAYHFVDKEFFEQDTCFIEKITFDGNTYGVHASEITRLQAEGFTHIVIVAEPVGVRQIRNWCKTNGIVVQSLFLQQRPEVLYSPFPAKI